MGGLHQGVRAPERGVQTPCSSKRGIAIIERGIQIREGAALDRATKALPKMKPSPGAAMKMFTERLGGASGSSRERV